MRFAGRGAWIAVGVLGLGILLAGPAMVSNAPTTQGAHRAAAWATAPQPHASQHAPASLDLTPRAGPVRPETVVAGVYVANIQRVDRTTNSFDADFYVWLRWSDPTIDPTNSIDVVNPYENWALTQTPVYDEPRIQADGTRVWLIHYQGSFNTQLSIADYPFEKQTLRIVLEDGENNITQIVYKPDKDPIELDPSITLAGYNLAQPHIKFDTNTYPSSFGELDTGPDSRSFARMTIEIPVYSPAVSGVVKIILPVIIVLITSALGLIIPASYVDSKVNVPITALIALVAMHFVIATALPDVNYLLMIDVIYILAYATVTALLAGAVLGAWVLQSQGEDAANRIQRRFLAATGVTFFVSLGVVMTAYLLI